MGAWVLAFCLLNSATPAMAADWELVARSDAIVSGEVSLRSTDAPSRDAMRLDLHRVQVIAGHAVGPEISVSLRGLTDREIARIRKLNSDAVVLFVGAYDETSGDLQLAADPEEALREYSGDLVKQVREAARANEAALLRAQAKRADYCTSSSELQRRVRELVARLDGGAEDVSGAVESLLGLGREAAPFVVCELDHARQAIAVRSVKVKVGAQGFEGYAHYTPQQKVDLLDMVLTSLTGVTFGSIVNGASAAQRDRVIRGWWVYFGRALFPEPSARIRAKDPGGTDG